MSVDSSAKPGYLKFKDVNKNGEIDPDDRQKLHSSEPDFIVGLTNSFVYQGFNLSFLINWREGGYSSNSWTNPGTNQYDNANILDLPYWTPDNPIHDRPGIGYPNPKGYGFYEKRSFVRLQDITLYYDVPNKFLKKWSVNNMKLYVSAKNVYTWTNWTGWDPEYGMGSRGQSDQVTESATPLMRSFTFGLSIGL
jgi:hypothetical protein